MCTPTLPNTQSIKVLALAMARRRPTRPTEAQLAAEEEERKAAEAFDRAYVPDAGSAVLLRRPAPLVAHGVGDVPWSELDVSEYRKEVFAPTATRVVLEVQLYSHPIKPDEAVPGAKAAVTYIFKDVDGGVMPLEFIAGEFMSSGMRQEIILRIGPSAKIQYRKVDTVRFATETSITCIGFILPYGTCGQETPHTNFCRVWTLWRELHWRLFLVSFAGVQANLTGMLSLLWWCPCAAYCCDPLEDLPQ